MPLERIVAEGGNSFTRTFNPFSPTARWVSTCTMYEPLMIQNYATGKLDPWLATGYEWSADALSLTVTLRDDVKWSDGQPFSADDVAFTYNLMKANPGLIGPAAGAFDQYLKSVEAVDAKTVKFTFSTTYTPGLYSLVDQFIVPQHVWKDVTDPVTFENPDPVATGPFTTIDAFGTDRYQVTKNPNYWQKLNIEGVFIQGFNGNDQVSAATLSGNLDWGGLVPDPDTTFVALDPEHFGYWWPPTSVVLLQANTTVGALADPVVRKAMSLALDRQRMINTGVWGKSVPANATGLPEGATISVGTNPTFPDVKSTRVEAHIHDLDEILYGLTAELTLVSRLRDTLRFTSTQELIAQTALDVRKSRQLLVELGLL